MHINTILLLFTLLYVFFSSYFDERKILSNLSTDSMIIVAIILVFGRSKIKYCDKFLFESCNDK